MGSDRGTQGGGRTVIILALRTAISRSVNLLVKSGYLMAKSPWPGQGNVIQSAGGRSGAFPFQFC